MTQTEMTQLLASLRAVPRDVAQGLAQAGAIVALPPGRRVFEPGQRPENFLLVISGDVRVQQVTEGGRELVLYRLSSGDSCTLTTACLLADQQYDAEAIAESEVTALCLGRGAFEDMLARSAPFRRYVFASFSARFTDLLHRIEDVAFERVDVRLAHLLASADGNILRTTHHALAGELGSAREVISRQLNEFQRRGWVRLARSTVFITNRAALTRLGGASAQRSRALRN